MKILQFSDLHLDARTCGVSRFDELSSVLDEVQVLATTEKCTDVVFSGDACDPDSTDAVRCITRLARFNFALNEVNIKTHWLPGNHDVIEDGHGSTMLDPLEWTGGLTYMHARPSVGQYEQGDVRIGWLPYPSKSTSYDPLAEVMAWPTDVKLVFGHLNLPGMAHGSESVEMARGRELYWPLDALRQYLPGAALFAGHYHVGGPHVVSTPRVGGVTSYSQVEIVGAPAAFAFGPEEKVDPAVLIIEAEKHGVSFTRRKLTHKRKGKLKTISLGAPRSEWEDVSFARVLVKPTDSQMQINKFRDQLMLTVSGVKLEMASNLAGPASVVEEATPMVTAEDGIAIAKQLAKDFATADTALKQEIEALTDLVAERACS